MDRFTRKVNDNAHSIKILGFILCRVSANMERKFSKYQQLLADLDYMIDGLDYSQVYIHIQKSTRKIVRIIRHCQ